MKKQIFLLLAIATATSLMAQSLPPITYNGEVLEYDTTFKRVALGYTPTYIPEVSGMSCSRTTPGYLWIQSDEVFRIAAINTNGTIFHKIAFRNCPKYKSSTRRDWEGLSTGVWQGKNYLFIGAFGDNDCQYKDNYYILYLEEPEINGEPNPAVVYDTIDNRYIRYGYPDGKAHNTEAIMYDNVDQKIYIIDKEEKHFCHVYSLRMDTVYGNDLQILKYECDLGKGDEKEFQRVTAADMTPDGRWIIIKNNYYVTPAGGKEETYAVALIWQRNSGESVVDALKRQPQQLKSYEVEWQGEAVAWLDSTTFYTTSDDDGRAPIYVYVRWGSTADLKDVDFNAIPDADKVMINGQVYIRTKESEYTLSGQKK